MRSCNTYQGSYQNKVSAINGARHVGGVQGNVARFSSASRLLSLWSSCVAQKEGGNGLAGAILNALQTHMNGRSAMTVVGADNEVKRDGRIHAAPSAFALRASSAASEPAFYARTANERIRPSNGMRRLATQSGSIWIVAGSYG
jgi:hypothetical protein